MTGLRLTQEGVSENAFLERFGRSVQDVFSGEIDDLVRKGLLEWQLEDGRSGAPDRRLRLTKRGHLLGNRVFLRFV